MIRSILKSVTVTVLMLGSAISQTNNIRYCTQESTDNCFIFGVPSTSPIKNPTRVNFWGKSGGLLIGIADTDISNLPGALIIPDAFISVTAPTNASVGAFAATAGTGVDISSAKTGSGTQLPIRFMMNPNEAARIRPNGEFLIGATATDTTASKLQVGGSISATGDVAGTKLRIYRGTPGAGMTSYFDWFSSNDSVLELRDAVGDTIADVDNTHLFGGFAHFRYKGSLDPLADDTYSLGNTDYRWKNMNLSGVLTVGSCVGCGGGAPSGVNGDIQFKTGTVLDADLVIPFRYEKANHRTLLGLASSDVTTVNGSIVSAGTYVTVTADVNASVGSFGVIGGSYTALSSSKTGTGTFLPLAFFTSQVERARFLTGGEFLVNRTTGDTTAAQLQVSGALSLTGTAQATGYRVFKGSPGTGMDSYFDIMHMPGNNNVMGIVDNAGTYVMMIDANHVFDTFGTVTFAGKVVPNADSLYDLGTSDYKWKNLWVSSCSGCSQWVNTSIGIHYDAGRVVVGASSPAAQTAQLTVIGTGTNTANIDTTAALGATLALDDIQATYGSGGAILFGAGSGAWRFASIKGYAVDGTANAAGHLIFSTRRVTSDATLTPLMVLTAQGNVGIQANGAVDSLRVFGTPNAASVDGARQIVAGESSNNAQYGVSMGYYLEPSTLVWTGSVQAYSANNPTPLILNGNGGRVGINTIYPGYPVSLGSEINSHKFAIFQDPTTGGNFYGFGIAPGMLIMEAGEVASTQFINNGVESGRINQAGQWSLNALIFNDRFNIGGNTDDTYEQSLSSNRGEIMSFQNNYGIAMAIGSTSNDHGYWLQSKFYTNDGRSFGLYLNPLGGRVAVGTVTPLTIMHVSNKDNTNAVLTVGGGHAGIADTGGRIVFRVDNFSPDTVGGAMIAGLIQYGGESAGQAMNLGFYTNQRTGANAYSGLVRRMLLDQHGRLGIGMDPTFTLDVNGNVRSGQFYTVNKNNYFGNASGLSTALIPSDSNIVLYDYATGNWSGIGADGVGNMWFRVGLGGVTDATMVLNASTLRVGIGTKDPAYKLDVVGDVNVTGAFRVNGVSIGGGGQWVVSGTNIYYNAGNVTVGGTATAFGGKFSVQNATALGTNAGDVNQLFEILGYDANASSLRVRHTRTQAGASWSNAEMAIQRRVDNVEMNYISFSGTNGDPSLIFGYGGTGQMWFNSAGNLGIGSPSGGARLQVYGALPLNPLNTAGTLAGYLELADSGATGGSGGGLLFSAGSTAWRFASIKGFATNGGNNSQGDIVFSTRRIATDGTLTESMRIFASGNTNITNELRINTSGVGQVSMVATVWTPSTDAYVSLGSPSNRFNTLYAAQIVTGSCTGCSGPSGGTSPIVYSGPGTAISCPTCLTTAGGQSISGTDAFSTITTDYLTISNYSTNYKVGINGQFWLPSVDNQVWLGDSTHRFGYIYTAGLSASDFTVTSVMSANTTAISIVTGIRINGNLHPYADNFYDLGTSATTYRWRDGFFSRNVSVGGQISAATGLISSLNVNAFGNVNVGSGNFFLRVFSGTPSCSGVADGWIGYDTGGNRIVVCNGGNATFH